VKSYEMYKTIHYYTQKASKGGTIK